MHKKRGFKSEFLLAVALVLVLSFSLILSSKSVCAACVQDAPTDWQYAVWVGTTLVRDWTDTGNGDSQESTNVSIGSDSSPLPWICTVEGQVNYQFRAYTATQTSDDSDSGICQGYQWTESTNTDAAGYDIDWDNDQDDCDCYLGPGNFIGGSCCGDDNDLSDNFNAPGTGCCCFDGVSSASIIGTEDDEICPGNSNLWCIDGTYCEEGIVRSSVLGNTLSGDNIICGCNDNPENLCDTSDSGAGVDGRCIDSSCCSSSIIVSGEYQNPLDFSDGDESCGCSLSEQGQICDSTASIYTEALSGDGRCIAATCCTQGTIASGESLVPDFSDGDESCGCTSSDNSELCDSASTDFSSGLSADGICGDTDNDNVVDSCITGPVCKDTENSNIIKDSCSECSDGGSDWDPYNSLGSGTTDFNGICIGANPDTEGEACFDGSSYQNDCSSCSSGDLCDSDITDGSYSANGLCTSGNCCTDYFVDINDNNLFDDNGACGSCALEYHNHRCDSDLDGIWDGICAYDGSSWLCDSNTIFYDGSLFRTSNDEIGFSTDGRRCENGAVGNNKFNQEGLGAGDVCDTLAPIECPGGAGNDCNPTCDFTSGYMCSNTLTSGDFVQEGICTRDGCDTSGESCFDGSEFRDSCSKCSYSEATSESGDSCDSSSATGGNYDADGICIYPGVCHTTGDICADRGDNDYFKNSCNSCSDGSMCNTSASINTFISSGHCVSGSCCTTTYIDINGNSEFDDGGNACSPCSASYAFYDCSVDGDNTWDGKCWNDGGFSCSPYTGSCTFTATIIRGGDCQNTDMTNSDVWDSFSYESSMESSFSNNSFVNQSTIRDSEIRGCSVNDSSLENSFMNDSYIINSRIANSALCPGMIVRDADIYDNVLISGRVIYLGNTYYSLTTVETICSQGSSSVTGYLMFNATSVKDSSSLKVMYASLEPGYEVTLDASAIGSGPALFMHDDGTNGDEVSGDGIYTRIVNVDDLSTGYKEITANVESGTDTWSVNKNIFVDNTLPLASIEVYNLINEEPQTYSANVVLRMDFSDNFKVDKCRIANDLESRLAEEDFEDCITEKIWTLSSGDGVKTVYFQVVDESGNMKVSSGTIFLNQSVLSDSNPPLPPVVLDDGDYINSDESLEFEWYNASDEENSLLYLPLSYNYKLWNGTSYIFSVNDTLLTKASISGLNLIEGSTYRLDVWAKDAAGLLSEMSSSDGITVDLSDPSLTTISSSIQENTWTSESLIEFNLSANDALSGISSYSYTIDRLKNTMPDDFPDTKTGYDTVNISNIGDGTYYFRVKALDKAGNSGAISNFTLKIDRTLPKIPQIAVDEYVLSSSNKTNFSISWTPSHDISGIDAYHIQISESRDFDDLVVNSTIGNVSSYLFSAPSDKKYYVRVRARNTVGLWSLYSDTLKGDIDVIPPKIEIIKPRGTTINKRTYLSLKTSEDSVCSFMDSSGIDPYSLMDHTGARIHDHKLNLNESIRSFELNISCKDAAGNENTSLTNFSLDTSLTPDSIEITSGDGGVFYEGLIGKFNFTIKSGLIPIEGFDLSGLASSVGEQEISSEEVALYDFGLGNYVLAVEMPELSQDEDNKSLALTISGSDFGLSSQASFTLKKLESEIYCNSEQGFLPCSDPSYTSIIYPYLSSPDIDYAHESGNKKYTIYSSLVYDDIIIEGDGLDDIRSGTYILEILNNGEDSFGNPVVRISLSEQSTVSGKNSQWIE
ncbi:MAG: choice-of-anchor X domain-containing protein [Candidatus Woesearchaeota archaeon]